MNGVVSLPGSGIIDRFKIDYPYYGLFRSAEIKPIGPQKNVFECQLMNGEVIELKRLDATMKWIDARLDLETPLAQIIGNCIDDFLTRFK